MDLAINYSATVADLVDRGLVHVDRFKCPAWPDLIASLTTGAAGHVPCYVHFPLLVGTGIGGPISAETNGPPDWDQIERLLEETHTPWVSAHMGPRPEDHPDLVRLAPDAQAATVAEALIRDLTPLVNRFGADRVVGENIFEFFGTHLRPAMLPDVLCRVVETTGCGFLLDLSHAQLAARNLDMDARAYIEALPVGHIREVHITGIQVFDAFWVERLRAREVDPDYIERISGHYIDHLPMTDDDWTFLEWAFDRIRAGAWREPEIIAFEYGGVGPEFEALTMPEVLEAQVPRLYQMVHA